MAPVDGLWREWTPGRGEQTIRGDQIRLPPAAWTFRALVEKEDATLLRGGIHVGEEKRRGGRTQDEVESVSRMAENEEATVAATVPDGGGETLARRRTFRLFWSRRPTRR